MECEHVMTTTFEPVPLTTVGLVEAAEVLGLAVKDDPIFVHCLPDSTDREQGVPMMMQSFLKLGLMHGEVWTTPPPITGVAWWIPSNLPPINRDEIGAAGVATAADAWGEEASARFQGFISDIGEVTSALGSKPHWHLSWIGVDPGHQGQGIGSALIRRLTSRVDADGVECDLYDFVPENVALYEHFGFKVAIDSVLPRSGLRLWVMVRQPMLPSGANGET
jgi:ribosomal protein S18 acetylase RimI-like enzyme